MSRREDIDNSIWHDPDFTDLSADARYLYLWSFTNPRCNMSGLYKLALDPIPAETGLTMKRIKDALAELAEATFAYYLEGVLWVRSRVSHLRSTNPNIAKSIARDVDKLALEHPLRVAFLAKYRHTRWLKDELSRFPVVEPNPETVTEPFPNGLQTVQGKGKGVSPSTEKEEQSSRDAEWDEWLDQFHATTGRAKVGGSAEARGFFNARREEGVSLADLKLAILGCHGDPYLRERKLNRPETILRASKFRRYIELAKNAETSPPTIDLDAARAGLPGLKRAWEEALPKMRAAVPEATFNLWLAPLRPIGVIDGTAVLSAPDGIRSWVGRRYPSLISEALGGSYGGVLFVAAPADEAEAA